MKECIQRLAIIGYYIAVDQLFLKLEVIFAILQSFETTLMLKVQSKVLNHDN